MTVELERSEEIVAMIRPKAIAYRLSAAFGFAVLVSSLFFAFPLLELGATGVLILVNMIGGSLLWMYRASLMKKHTLILFTDRRFVHVIQHGLIGRTINEYSYNKAWKAVHKRSGLVARMLGLATVRLKRGKQVLELPWVDAPEKVTNFMNEVQCLKSKDAKAK
jgi:hypothetical protein